MPDWKKGPASAVKEVLIHAVMMSLCREIVKLMFGWVHGILNGAEGPREGREEE